MNSGLWSQIRETAQAAGEAISNGSASFHAESGGCIHQAWCVTVDSKRWFVKTHAAPGAKMLEAEFLGLQSLRAHDEIRLPEPLACGVTDDTAWLLLKHLELRSGQSTDFDAMGRQLAHLHRHTSATGLHGDAPANFIGRTPQQNNSHKNWADFFRNERLAVQFDLSRQAFPESAQMLEAVPVLLAGHDPEPSALHGDLWGGNAGFIQNGSPVIFDPAFYHGDRETDLAFTHMFGGFSAAFYQGYEREWPLPAGHEDRQELYNLYHTLNHHHLFGEPYGQQARSMIRRLLRRANSITGG